MPASYVFSNQQQKDTIIQHEGEALWLNRLFGVLCGKSGIDSGPARTRGLICCSTSLGRFEADDIRLENIHSSAYELAAVWSLANGNLHIEMRWVFDPGTGILLRSDRLVNHSHQPVILYRYFARFTFSMRHPQVYSQRSAWIEENQGCWMDLHHGKLELACERGRTTCGGTPFFAVRETGSSQGAIFHLLPTGNWLARIYNYAVQMTQPYTIVELGISDEDLRLVIPPGEAFTAPDILLQAMDGQIQSNSHLLHGYLCKQYPSVGWVSDSADRPPYNPPIYDPKNVVGNGGMSEREGVSNIDDPKNMVGNGGMSEREGISNFDNPKDTAGNRGMPANRRGIPIIYNTWFFQFENLEVPLLRQQLLAAKELGCDMFVIDAGWYGPQGEGWWNQAGDWREKTDTAFHGKMTDFADEVRKAGLGFGLWMEPERFVEGVPILKDHPEWFYHAEGNLYRIDLENPQAYKYLKGEICRLLDTYQLAWMKIDFNFELGIDPSGAELYRYYQRWYALLDELKAEYPNTVFEGCSSGAMRGDIHSTTHFSFHFLSDTVNPVDMIRLTQGAWLRLPPGWIGHWCVLRSVKMAIPHYPGPAREAVVVPGSAGFENFEKIDTNFAVLAALPGVFGLSGDIADLPEEAKQRLRWAVNFAKRWGQFMAEASGRLLTPPSVKEDRTGWVAYQLDAPGNRDTPIKTTLLYVYRLYDRQDTQVIYPQGLTPGTSYLVKREDELESSAMRITAEELISQGLTISLPQQFLAALYSIIANT